MGPQVPGPFRKEGLFQSCFGTTTESCKLCKENSVTADVGQPSYFTNEETESKRR